jgi:GNAT superfamily N-acetyltransferase
LRLDFARLSDIPRLAELLGFLFRQESDFKADPRKQTAGLRLILRDTRRGKIFTVRHGGTVIGMLTLLFTVSTAEGGPAAWLEDFILDPAWRGKGIGTKLIEHAIAYARQKGIKRITLLTDRTNVRASRLYRRWGFQGSGMVPLRLSLKKR